MWETFELCFYFLWLLTIKTQTQTSCPITNHPHSAKPGCTLQPWMQRPGRCWRFNRLSIAVSCCEILTKTKRGNGKWKNGVDFQRVASLGIRDSYSLSLRKTTWAWQRKFEVFSFYHYVNPLLCVIWGFLCQLWWLPHIFDGEKKVTFKKKKTI